MRMPAHPLKPDAIPVTTDAPHSEAVGPRTRGFRGLRYVSPTEAQLDLGIDGGDHDAYRDETARLRDQDPYNIRHLAWPSSPMVAIARRRTWEVEHVLCRDPESTYLIEYSVGSHRVRGVLVEVDVSSSATVLGIIPHEDVDLERAKAMRGHVHVGRADIEPVLLVQDMTARARSLITILMRESNRVSVTVGKSRTVEVRRVEDSVATDLHAEFSRRIALIADGHHRYAAHAHVGHVLAMITDVKHMPLRLSAIHRLVRSLSLKELVAENGPVRYRPMPAVPAGGIDMALSLCRDDEFLVTDGENWVRGRLEDGLSADVVAMHTQFGPLVEARGLSWEYRHVAEDARVWAHVNGGTAFMLHPPQVAGVLKQVSGGARLPEKATSFWPKPELAMVIRVF